jgi:hypothetical protein
MSRQCVAHLMPVAGHDIEDAGWKAHLSGELRHADQGQAGVFCRFDHAGVPCGQGAANAAYGGNEAWHAQWVTVKAGATGIIAPTSDQLADVAGL